MVAGHMRGTVEFGALGEGDSAGTSSADGINDHGPERTAEMRFGRMERVESRSVRSRDGDSGQPHVDAVPRGCYWLEGTIPRGLRLVGP